jgi:hypothetical protein
LLDQALNECFLLAPGLQVIPPGPKLAHVAVNGLPDDFSLTQPRLLGKSFEGSLLIGFDIDLLAHLCRHTQPPYETSLYIALYIILFLQANAAEEVLETLLVLL